MGERRQVSSSFLTAEIHVNELKLFQLWQNGVHERRHCSLEPLIKNGRITGDGRHSDSVSTRCLSAAWQHQQLVEADVGKRPMTRTVTPLNVSRGRAGFVRYSAPEINLHNSFTWTSRGDCVIRQPDGRKGHVFTLEKALRVELFAPSVCQ